MVAQSLTTQLKQSFIVEDIGGGGAIIGSEKVARATHSGTVKLKDKRPGGVSEKSFVGASGIDFRRDACSGRRARTDPPRLSDP
jgi:hypothetical protein